MKKYTPTKFKAKDSVYDKTKADYAVSFIECLCHTKGTWAGKPFTLIDWQEQIIRDIFGIIKPNGYRQFNTAYIEIPKKMGKSELAARSHFCSHAATVRNVRRSTAALRTGSKPRLFLRSQPIWSECVRPSTAGSKS